MKINECHVISNTHWDREWVKSFQESRIALTDMFDKLFELMDQNPEFRHFHLDSQAIPLEDYCTVRPENKEKLKSLISNGKLLTGPWYTLAEMNSIDGESIIRNLLIGHRVSGEFGKVMKVGYTPTSTGQISQLPQIYNGFGIKTVVFYRGINQDVAPPEYIWKAPDGTESYGIRPPQHFSRCTFWGYVYLPIVHKYYDHIEDSKQNQWSNGGMLFRIADHKSNEFTELEPVKYFDKEYAEQALKKLMSEISGKSHCNVLLALHGHDASFPHEETPALIAALNEISEDTHFIHSSFEKYAESISNWFKKQKKIVVLEGEMRYTNQTQPWNDAHLYPGVISTKGRLKRRNREIENLLIRLAEPATTLSKLSGDVYEAEILDIAWKLLLANHAHDTINGCSLDAVYEDAMHRYQQAEDIARQILNRSLARITKKINLKSFDNSTVFLTVFNLDIHKRGGTADIVIDMPTDTTEKGIVLEDNLGRSIPAQVNAYYPHKSGVDKIGFSKTHHSIRFHLNVFLPDNPGGGYTTYRVRSVPKAIEKKMASNNCMENEYLHLKVEGDGSLSVTDKQTGILYSGLNTFADEGELGNAWTPGRIPNGEIISTRNKPAIIELTENGPVKSTFRIKHTMHLPVSASGNYSCRSAELRELVIITDVSLYTQTKSIRVTTSLNNTVKDHRLRVLFPSGMDTDIYKAAMPFDVVTRTIPKATSRNWTEQAEPSDPHLGFLDVSNGNAGLAITNIGLFEAEVLNDPQKTIAITLLRSFYQHGNWTKDRWPDVGFQNPGEHTFMYNICPHEGDWYRGNVYHELASLDNPLICVQHGTGNRGTMPLKQSLFSLEGPLQVSCLKQSEDAKAVVLRIYNPSEFNQKGTIRLANGITSATITDMEEKPLEKCTISGSQVTVNVDHHKIVTLKLHIN